MRQVCAESKLTGKGVLQFLQEKQDVLTEASKALKTTPNDILNKVEQLQGEVREATKQVEKLSAQIASIQMTDLFNLSRDIKGVNVIAVKLSDVTADMMRMMGDQIKEQEPKTIAVLSTVSDGKIQFLCVCGKEAVKSGAHAGKIVKEVAKMCGGGGGGRPDNATAGGKDPSKLEEALEAVNNIVDAQLGESKN